MLSWRRVKYENIVSVLMGDAAIFICLAIGFVSISYRSAHNVVTPNPFPSTLFLCYNTLLQVL